MVMTDDQTNNHVNLVQVCSLNIEQNRLLQFNVLLSGIGLRKWLPHIDSEENQEWVRIEKERSDLGVKDKWW